METKSSKSWIVIILLAIIAITGWFLVSKQVKNQEPPAPLNKNTGLALPNSWSSAAPMITGVWNTAVAFRVPNASWNARISDQSS